MPRRKRKIRIAWENRPEPHNRGEAIESIQDGVTFFLKKKPIATLLVLGGTLLGFIWGGSAYLADKRDVRFEDRKPLSEAQTPNDGGLFVGSLYAASNERGGYQGDTLWLHGKAWALVDSNYQLWKEYGKPILIVHDKRDSHDQPPAFLYIESFDDQAIQKQMQKSK